MKAQIKKFAALAFSMCLLLSLMVVGASAGETTSYYEKVTTAPADWSGEYLIVYEKDANTAYVMNSGLPEVDAVANHFTATITDGKIEANATTNAAKVTIAAYSTGYSIKMANGKYTGNSGSNNDLKENSSALLNTITLTSAGDADIESGTFHLRFNPQTSGSNNRFRYYKASSYATQQPIHLYKLTTTTGGGSGSGSGSGEGSGGAGGGSTYTPPAADSVLTIPQALEVGQKIIEGETVTNSYYVVGEIKNVYNTQYGNMYIKDAQGNEICIYGLYKDSVRYDAMTTKPVAGDTIKVYGKISQFNGTIQFKNAELIEHTPATPNPGQGGGSTYTPPAADSVLTIPQALEVGQKIIEGETVTNSYYVVGEIKNVYNTQYGNMYIKDAQGNEICIYGLYKDSVRYDAMTTKPVAGDTIKVYGKISQFNGNIQFKNAELIEHTPAGGATPPPSSDPAADSTLTIEQAVALGNTKSKNEYTTGKYYIEGTVKSIENPTYGNMYVEDANGNKILVYGVYSNDGSVRYDAMTTKPVVGDTVKLYGVIGMYNEAQMQNGWLISMQSGGGSAPVAPSDPKQIVDEAFALASGKYLAYSATLTGVVTDVQEYSEEHGNATFVMTVEGTTGEKELLCYRVKAADGSNVDLSALAVGDKVTVTGSIKNHYDTIEFDNSSRVTAIVAAGSGQGGAGDEDDDDILGGGAEDDDDIQGGGNVEDDKLDVPATGDAMQTTLAIAMLVMLASAVALVLCGKKAHD